MKQKFTKLPSKSQYSPFYYSIRMKISTWNKDSHGLYDYESNCENYRNEIFYIEATTVVFRDANSNNINIKDPITVLQFESSLRNIRDSFLTIGKIAIDRK